LEVFLLTPLSANLIKIVLKNSFPVSESITHSQHKDEMVNDVREIIFYYGIGMKPINTFNRLNDTLVSFITLSEWAHFRNRCGFLSVHGPVVSRSTALHFCAACSWFYKLA
jgi:hypothetical protein